MRFRDDPTFGSTLDAAAEILGISPTAIEKDYWVTQVLRVLADEFQDDFIFKGGTSLSKGFGIIERFSEDVDVLVLTRDRGRGAVDKVMKTMSLRAAAGIGGAATGVAAETGRHRAYRLSYPATRLATPLIATNVLLEMGCRGGPHPHEPVAIGSLLGTALGDAGVDVTDFEDLTPCVVAVLHPGRTLLEKLAHVHAMALRLDGDEDVVPPARSGRHFYDIYQLLGDARVVDLLSERDEVTQIIASIDAITQQFFGGTQGDLSRPPRGYASSPAFTPGSSVSERLQLSYESTMPDLYFGVGPVPTWTDVLDRVREYAALL